MKITLQTVGGVVIEFDAALEKQIIHTLSFWQSLPSVCPRCKSSLAFFYRNPKDNSYYGLVCSGTPRRETNFGQHKVGDGLYYKNEWQDAFAGIQTERDREINQFDDAISDEKAALIVRIEKANAAIRTLKGKPGDANLNAMSVGELKEEVNAANAQYKRLEANK